MELLALLEDLRSDYLTEYASAYYQLLERNEEVYPEVALEISGVAYKQIFAVDFLHKNGETIAPIEVDTTGAAYGGDVAIQYKSLSVEFGRVSWDSMRFTVSPAPAEFVGFEPWFDYWIDLERTQHQAGSIHSRVIHSSRLAKGLIEVDFGTATLGSFIELLEIFEANGVKTVRVSSSRE